MKGILLAGGSGSRLCPMTVSVSKQLLPVYDKPMVYYPLSVLMLAGIRDVLLISTPQALSLFRGLFGDGSRLGIRMRYKEQPRPEGLAQALLIAEEFLAGSPACLILGDNIFYGNGLTQVFRRSASLKQGARIFGYHVSEPKHYGVVEIDSRGRPVSIEEKPASPRSNWAVPGLYFYDSTAVDRAKTLKPSARGELEITDLNLTYLQEDALEVHLLGRGITWLDTGTSQSLLEAGNFIEAIQNRQGVAVACIEEIALRNGWVDRNQVEQALEGMGSSEYTAYLERLIQQEDFHETH